MNAHRSSRVKWCNMAILIAFAAMLVVCISPALASALTCDCDICVNETGWWRDGGASNGNGTPIQAAIDAATVGETICVYNGSYSENVNVNKNLTLRGEGADVVNVSAASADDHVFEVTVNYVNISGFNVSGATGWSKAGIYLSSSQHCTISNNNASSNYDGIYLSSSSNNTLTNNTANSNIKYGIYLFSSSNNNTLTNNLASNNEQRGIYLFSSSNNNTLTNNTANSNTNYGIYLSSSSNNTFMNNTANSNNIYGIYLQKSSNNMLKNNTANSNTEHGIYLYSSSNNTFMNNTANSNNRYGIYLQKSSNNMLKNNTANSNTEYGIYLSSSSNNMLMNNTFTENGLFVSNSYESTVANNTVNDKPLVYYEDASDITVQDAGQVVLVNCSNITAEDLNISYASVGVELCETNDCVILNNTVSNGFYGIYLDSSSNNTLMNNTASNNEMNGICLSSSSNNNLTNNTANSNEVNGISLHSPSNYNTLTNNIANSNNNSGIKLSGFFGSCNYNTLTNNTANSNNNSGIELLNLFGSCNYNTLMSNNADSNNYGIHMYSSSNNTIYNNYFNNTYNAYDDGNNIWNTTPTPGTNIIGGSWLGGNYWSDYAGSDINGDDLGDTLTPYNSSGNISNGGDYHPLVMSDPITFNCTCGDICVNETGWWRDGGVLNASGTPIQAAIDAATAGETICVWNGSYTENVNVNKKLTLRGEGADVVNVTTANSNDHVFNVTVDYVNISGFNVTEATGSNKAGICLGDGVEYCNISDNNASNSECGILLYYSSNFNTLTNNTANSNSYGILLYNPGNYNTLANNTANSNINDGIYLYNSTNNILANNTANLNTNNGIYLSSSSNNTLANNTANLNTNYSIFLYSSSSNNTLTYNTASDNYCGIFLYSSSNNNTLTSNTASDNYYGIYLNSSSNNTIYNNYFNNTHNAYDDGNNTWNTTLTAGTNIIDGSWLGGNYWFDYAGADTNSDGLGDTLLPYNSSGNISNGGDYHPLVTPGFAAPNITESAPPVSVSDTAGATRTFNITVDQTVNVTWYINGTSVQETNTSITVANYTNTSAEIGVWNISAMAENANGTDMQTWIWNVTTESATYNCTCGDICVNTSGWWRDGGVFNANNTPIQAAIDNATDGETIYVYNGSYTENVNVNKQLTMRGEGADVVNVTAALVSDHVFNMTADYVNISGFNVSGPIGSLKAGIYLGSSQHCNILNNNASGNLCGIYLSSSSNNTLTNNTANSNIYGIFLQSSSNNTLTNNTLANNMGRPNSCGILLQSSSNNTLANNTANSNSLGIILQSSSNNTLTSNTANLNSDRGIYLYSSSNNTITNNTADSNANRGIHLYYSSNYNTIYNNHFNNTYNAYDNGINIWNTTPTAGTNIFGSSWLGGNYWSDYEGADTTGDGLGDTLTPYNSSDNITNGGDHHPLVTPGFAAPNITSSAPLTSVSDTAGSIRTFNITVDQIVNVTWYINGTNVQDTNISVTATNYTNTSAEIGVWNVSAVAENANGTDMQTWVWNVTAVSTYNCTCGDICVNTSSWWRDGGVLNSSGTPIQAAIDNATPSEIIYVYNGSYTENVNVDKRLTLRGEGADVVNVTNSTAGSHVFEVTANYVNISGFNVSGATSSRKAGIHLNNRQYCNISENDASNNNYGIHLYYSSNNTLTNNTVDSNNYSIHLYYSSNNTLTNNTADSNNYGIHLSSSSNNILTNNTLTNNTADSNNNYGICLSYSSYNTLTNNTADSNDDYGIYLYSSSNNTLTNNTADSNNYGIYLSYSSNNTFMNNTADSNNYGIYLRSSSNNNTLTNNTADLNDDYSIYLSSSSNSTIYNNYFNNTNNAWDNGNNTWNTTPTAGTNIIGGSWLGGNYWSDYEGADTTGDGLGDTLTPYNSSGNITYGGDYHPLVTPCFAAPNITSSAPPTSVSDTAGTARMFNITIDQIVNVTWYINGTNVQDTNTSVTAANYTNTSAEIGVWNVSAVAENANGTDMQTWVWNVTTVPTFNCTCGDICVNTSGWWRGGGAFNASGTQIQAAVNNATAGETIYVYNGSYNENVDVDKRVTLAGEGADVVNVTAASSDDYVFGVTVDCVNISGFNVSGATGSSKAGIYLSGRQHCNISGNTASNNYCGIYLRLLSNNNTLTNNTASNNDRGICLEHSSNNTLTSNTANSNRDRGIYLYSSSNNTITNNTADSNANRGIRLYYSSNYNTIYNNHFNNTNNAYDNGNNIWNTTPTTGTNIIGGSWLGGNYWFDYAGADTTGDGLGDTLIPYNSSSIIQNGGDYHPLATPGAAPNITSFAPESSVNDTYCTWRIFNVSVDQTVNVTWYLNGTPQTPLNESMTEANYTFHAEYISEHNVSAVAENANGTDMQTWIWNVTQETTPPAIMINAPTQSSPVNRTGGEQLRVNFTYTELYPANYTVMIGNATEVINSITNESMAGGTDMTVNESFYLNASAADGWYNVTVEMYDNFTNYNITHQNYSIEKGSYNASISQPENQTTQPSLNATYEINITNIGSFAGTFTLAVTNYGGADIAVLNRTTIVDLASGSSQNVTLNVTGASAGTYNVTVNVTSNDSGSEVASTGYIMTTVLSPILTIGNVTDITSDWGRDFNLNHSVTVTNATASNVNVSYNVSWINGCELGTVNKDVTEWCNQTQSNSTVQKITVRMDANSTTSSATNDTGTFDINITRRDINVTSDPVSEQTIVVGETFWINGSAKGEYAETFIGKADLIRNGSIIDNKTITDGNVNFSTNESTAGTFNFSIQFYNTTHYNNASTSNLSVTVLGPILTLGNVTDITSDWGRYFNLNHSVTVTNATVSNVNVSYNVSWIDGCELGTVNKDAIEWCNQTRSNSTVQKITVRVDANSTTSSTTNDTGTFNINITRRNINVTSDPVSEQTVGVGETFWINGSAIDEYNEVFIVKADLIKDGSIVNTTDITNGNVNFSTNESAAGTFNFSIRFYNTTHYNNATTSNATMGIVDNTPPASITDLQNITYEPTYINWTWTDPADADFDKVMIYLNGTFARNVSKGDRNYNATGLNPDTNHTISTHTVDTSGNINQTWVNDTARTLPFSQLHHINVTPTTLTLNINESGNLNATGFDHNNDSIDNLIFAWYTTPSSIGTLNNSTGSVIAFTARHVGRSRIYAVNDNISSNETYKVWITVNAPPETGNVINGTGNATSGNSTTIVDLNNRSINGTITIKEIGDPINKTEDLGNRTGLGTDTESIKGVNVTVNGSIEVALNDMGGYLYIRIEYNESQLGNIDENTLHIYKFVNATGWVKLVKGNPSYCIANGRNIDADYVWVNVTECSIFMLAGTPKAAQTPSGGGGGGGPYITSTPTVLATEVQTDVSVNGDMAAPAGTETEDDEASGLGVDTGTDESSPAQTGNKGLLVFGLVGLIVGIIIIVLVIRRKNASENE